MPTKNTTEIGVTAVRITAVVDIDVQDADTADEVFRQSKTCSLEQLLANWCTTEVSMKLKLVERTEPYTAPKDEDDTV